MTPKPLKLLPAGVILGLVLVLTSRVIPAQQPIPLLPPPATQPAQAEPAAQADPNAPDVLARGPVHEAFASTAEAPSVSPIVPKKPPEPIEELPPDQKPEGNNVQWLPGYWHWDDNASQFIWISGFWRTPPPGRIWVPGSWRKANGGFQWAPGFWQEPAPQQAQQPQQQPEIQYLPPPPQTIEVGPTVPAATATSFYVPGSWVWRGRYVWRPGFWVEHRVNWVWVPAHYRWSPVGYVFVDGYWDYPLATRGVLYAPVAFSNAVYLQPGFVYTPAYVVSEPCMVGTLFVRRGYGCYYFGDYFAPQYATVGFTAWCGTVGVGGGFAVGFGVGRTWGYDPLWSYYSVAYRTTPGWSVNINLLYGGRYNGTIARPPVSLHQQNVVINKITNVTNVTNVTNNVTVVNKNVTVNNKDVTHVAMLAPAKFAKDLQPEAKMQTISAESRKDEALHSKQIREVAVQRTKLENTAVAQGKIATKATDAPRSMKLDVPKNIVARSQVIDQKNVPPANPHKDIKTATKIDPTPGVTPRINTNPLPKVDHKIDPQPKIEQRPLPKVEPNPIVIPKAADPKTQPKIDPKVDPKLDPKPVPKFDPRFEPKFDPKADPKGSPKSDPKHDPKREPKN